MDIRYPLSNDTWGKEELDALESVISSGQFTMGKQVAAAEQAVAAYFGSRYAVMSSSGSAANLLAVASMVYSGKLARGDEFLEHNLFPAGTDGSEDAFGRYRSGNTEYGPVQD